MGIGGHEPNLHPFQNFAVGCVFGQPAFAVAPFDRESPDILNEVMCIRPSQSIIGGVNIIIKFNDFRYFCNRTCIIQALKQIESVVERYRENFDYWQCASSRSNAATTLSFKSRRSGVESARANRANVSSLAGRARPSQRHKWFLARCKNLVENSVLVETRLRRLSSWNMSFRSIILLIGIYIYLF